jgi:hypothetical protein
MHFSFLQQWRRRHGHASGEGAAHPEPDPAGMAVLLAECELLREEAGRAGVELDDSADSLSALDQLLPLWREDPEKEPWLGGDAGLYLGTVLVRTVPGAAWHLWPEGGPVVRLASGLEVDVLEEGRSWAATGSPELAHIYWEILED